MDEEEIGMIKGLSYQNGVFFIGKENVSCAYDDNGKIAEWVKPLTASTLFLMMRYVYQSMPGWFKLLSFFYIGMIVVPKIIAILPILSFNWSGLPFYFLFYFVFGTHFIFPMRLRKYHGAEHKVFSDRGVKKRGRLFRIKRAAITNRYCSTNIVVIYFSAVIVLLIGLLFFLKPSLALEWASYGALLFMPIVNKTMHWNVMKPIRYYVLKVSYYLQKKITTAEPERVHLLTAIQSYRMLASVEFPEHLVEKPLINKEEKHLAIVDVTIIPIGTKGPSVSDYVTDIHLILEKYSDKINYQLTPMSTIIEGELPILFEVIQAIHEAPFKAGIERVSTNIRIDDRRDRALKMSEKVAAVERKIEMRKAENQNNEVE